MTDETKDKGLPPGGSSNRWAWVLGIAVLVTIGIWLLTRPTPVLETDYAPSPLAGIEPLPIRVPPELTEADSIPESPGALSGGNLLLVTLDSTRADRIGCYGNPDIQTPAIDGLARRGVVFSQAVTPAPTTAAAHASILTGLYPNRHGVRGDGIFRLADDHQTLAEILAARSYATAAVISCFLLDDRFGFAQGFGTYDEQVERQPGGPGTVAERAADRTADRAAAWLREHGNERFFLWVHFFDAHAPYEPPSPFAGDYRDLPYDGEIAFADAQLGGLLGVVDELGITDQTLLVVAGDHGEDLDQHGESGHGYLLYDSTLRVPLVMSCGDRLGGGVHVSRRVSLVDVMPTALSLLGVEGPDSVDGIDLTEPVPEQRVVFAETLCGLVNHGWASLFAAYQGPNKYIHGPDPELFDLAADPFELQNLAASGEQMVADLQQRLVEAFGSEIDETTPGEAGPQISAEDLAALESLGYVGATSAGDRTAPVSRSDPKTALALKYRVDAVMEVATSEAGLDPAVEELKKIIADHPDFEPAFAALGECYRRLNRLDWAESAYLKANELSPNLPHTVLALAQIKMTKNEREAAAVLYRQLVSLYPDHLQGQAGLGVVLRELGRLDEAVEPLTRTFQAVPSDPTAQQALLEVFRDLDRTDEGIALLRQCLERRPTLASLRDTLARWLYDAKKDYAAAIALLRQGLELTPDNPQLAANLGLILARCDEEQFRRPAEAVDLLKRACELTQYRQPDYMFTLALAYDAAGQLDYAIGTAERAQQVAQATGRTQLTETLERLLTEWRARKSPATTTGPATQPAE